MTRRRPAERFEVRWTDEQGEIQVGSWHLVKARATSTAYAHRAVTGMHTWVVWTHPDDGASYDGQDDAMVIWDSKQEGVQ